MYDPPWIILENGTATPVLTVLGPHPASDQAQRRGWPVRGAEHRAAPRLLCLDKWRNQNVPKVLHFVALIFYIRSDYEI